MLRAMLSFLILVRDCRCVRVCDEGPMVWYLLDAYGRGVRQRESGMFEVSVGLI